MLTLDDQHVEVNSTDGRRFVVRSSRVSLVEYGEHNNMISFAGQKWRIEVTKEEADRVAEETGCPTYAIN